MTVIAALNGVFNVAAAGNAFMDLRLPLVGGVGNIYVVLGMFVLGFVWIFERACQPRALTPCKESSQPIRAWISSCPRQIRKRNVNQNR